MKRNVIVVSLVMIALLSGVAIYSADRTGGDVPASADTPTATSSDQTPVEKETPKEEKKFGLLPGYYAPDFTLPNLEGKNQSLSDFQGKYVLLNFWAIWCPPCRAEMPALDQFHRENSDQMIVLGVELGSKPAQVSKFIKEGEYEYPFLLDEKDQIARVYRISVVPTTYILNPEGKILHVLRGAVTEEQLEVIKETFVK